MTKLFIANCTKTHQDVHYTVRELNKVFKAPIKIGCQVQVWRDAPKEELEYIVDQLRKYGLKDSKEAYKDKNFVGLCYSFDKPVQADFLEAMIEKNYQLLDDKAQEDRVNTALVLNHSIQSSMEQNGMPGSLRDLSVTVKEEKRAGDIGKTPLEEVVQINRSIQGGMKKQRRVSAA